MVGNVKCLRTLLIAGVYSAITITLSDCKPSFNVDSLLAGDKDKSKDKIAHTIETSHLDSPATEARTKREWSKFNSWGKRRWDKMNFATWGKRKWNNFASWGKRSIGPSDEDVSETQVMPKREWSQFNSWGKRTASALPDGSETAVQNVESSQKRSEEALHNDMEADKRKWSQFASWGKRSDEDEYLTPYKRKWSQFASWGKRDSNQIPDMDERMHEYSDYLRSGESDDNSLVSDIFHPEKRKWSQFAAWGKRDIGQMDDLEKRKWSQFASWGKRMDDNDLSSVDKRGWAEFNSWGKRLRNARNWAALNTWGKKRRWTGLPTWGKRSSGPVSITADAMVDKLLMLFDDNDDMKLDVAELRKYIQTLMALPTEVSAKNVEAEKDVR